MSVFNKISSKYWVDSPLCVIRVTKIQIYWCFLSSKFEMMRALLTFILLSFGALSVSAQSPFSISLHSIEIPTVGGVQSFAVGQYDGKWLIIGGRLDGLHRRQPWASFDLAGHNDQLTVIDPVGLQSWTAETTSLGASLSDQLHATNMEFYQVDDQLYLVGGYGYSSLIDDHTTFPFLTAVHVSGLMDAIIGGEDIEPFFRQLEDEQFAVTGGYLERIESTFYLVGGQNFEGRYNPMDMPTFTQEYTDAIRRFNMSDDGSDIMIDHLDPWVDATNMHRRDFNVLPQILPDGSEGLTAFSGVFQPDADIPFLDCVNISNDGYEVQPDFSQYYNHYHCASIPLYSESQNEMHTLFFGGIAQYYEEDGELVMDDEVPFVKTIARVTRTEDGVMTEYKLPIELPDYLGSGAEFVPLESLDTYPNQVIDLDALEGDSVLIGHIYGGIESSAKNIFWINTGNESVANSGIFEVYILPGQADAIDELNPQSQNHIRMQLYPNSQTGLLYVDLMMSAPADVIIQIFDLSGQLIEDQEFKKGRIRAGENELIVKMPGLRSGHGYVVRAISAGDTISQKMIVNE